MSMNSMTLRWRTAGVCALTVLAMLALLGGCGKKAEEQAETTTEEVPAAETQVSPMAGTYAAEMTAVDASARKVTLTLNADNTAMMSTDLMNDQPAMVENGTWAMGAGANMVDVTFQKQMGDVPTTVTLNFMASGDTLSLTNAEAAGFGTAGVMLVKQSAMGEAGHEGHAH
jgi:hypothetical protein